MGKSKKKNRVPTPPASSRAEADAEEDEEDDVFMDAPEYTSADINAMIDMNRIRDNFARHNISSITQISIRMKTLDAYDMRWGRKPIHVILYFKSRSDASLEMNKEFEGFDLNTIIAEVNEFIKREIKI